MPTVKWLDEYSVNVKGIDFQHQPFLPLYPYAVEQLDVGSPEVVVTFSHSAAKGVLTRSESLHLCYCHTPVRYAWDLYHEYLRLSGLERGIKSLIARWILHYIRLWDRASAADANRF